MKSFDSKNIKNVVLLGHAGCGKTTMAEAMLFEAGVINRRGTVEDGNTVSDHTDLERERGNSIFNSLMHLTWKDNKINLIDTPGFDDFIGEVIASLHVADTAVMIINGQQGVEVGTEIIWDYISQSKKPTVFVVNQMDSDKTNFNTTVEQIKNRFGSSATVVQYPYNPGPGFNAIIDVLKMVMYKFPEDGGKPEKVAIPADHRDQAEELHNELIEAIAVNDEALMELYFEKGELTEDEMAEGLKKSIVKQDFMPIFVTSAKQNMGSGRVMGFIRDHGPAAADMPPTALTNGETLACDSSGNTCLFVYNTNSEQNLGNMSYFKIYSGTLASGSDLINSESQNSERLNQIFVMNGKNREQVEELKAGDIGVTVKLKNTATNTSLYEKGKELIAQPIKFPTSRIQFAVHTDNKADMEKLAQALYQVRAEDPALEVENSQELKQTLVSGQGELHLTIVKRKVEDNYKVKYDYIEPKIPFRETIRKGVKSMYRHKKQTGGAGQFAEIHIYVDPYYEGCPDPPGLDMRRSPEIIELDWGGNLVFQNCIVGGAIDTKFMSAIMKGIMEKMIDGPLTGSYVRDVRVCVYDGKMHAVDSNDMAFKLAASMAFKSAFEDASPQLLEPVYDVEVLAASETTGDVMSDLQTRRAIIMGMEAAGHYQKIKARVPLMELYKYASTLRSISQGRAKHSQQFAEYGSVPSDVQDKLIKAHKAATGEE